MDICCAHGQLAQQPAADEGSTALSPPSLPRVEVPTKRGGAAQSQRSIPPGTRIRGCHSPVPTHPILSLPALDTPGTTAETPLQARAPEGVNPCSLLGPGGGGW